MIPTSSRKHSARNLVKPDLFGGYDIWFSCQVSAHLSQKNKKYPPLGAYGLISSTTLERLLGYSTIWIRRLFVCPASVSLPATGLISAKPTVRSCALANRRLVLATRKFIAGARPMPPSHQKHNHQIKNNRFSNARGGPLEARTAH